MSWRMRAGWSLRRWLHCGAGRSCIVCGSHVRAFLSAGETCVRADARCPVCGSLERHRLVWAFLERQTDLFDGRQKRLLHVAPEPAFTERLRRIPSVEYLSADRSCARAMVQMDITSIPFPDHYFDVILCSHVLEHVEDDRRAMRELCRVLRPSGWAVLQVPITAPATLEDPSITEPTRREQLFGQKDHVRAYGPDYADRLREAGFTVTVQLPPEFLSPTEIERFRVLPTEAMHFCRKA